MLRLRMTRTEIELYLDSLSHADQLELLRLLTERLQAPALAKKQPGKLSELAGLGAEIWEGIDPAEYVRGERASWD